jgi:hypothetical protein
VVPQDQIGTNWMPTLEAAAAGIAAARFHPDRAPLMGVSAARLHGALPRALAVAIVAAPARHDPITLLDRPASVRFVKRDQIQDAMRARLPRCNRRFSRACAPSTTAFGTRACPGTDAMTYPSGLRRDEAATVARQFGAECAQRPSLGFTGSPQLGDVPSAAARQSTAIGMLSRGWAVSALVVPALPV